ncbi:hypothetical protein D1631_04980 [Chryseobacterium nematophagum]|uniref:Uncharacterized protein n=1 Tax=Chryseobacterium nematophagum TaxID=2305228 RepID=A0A3M7TCX7_9FLAO|nr:hypothetical protein D1631_04980 [Chryseobacterium nematophagum]
MAQSTKASNINSNGLKILVSEYKIIYKKIKGTVESLLAQKGQHSNSEDWNLILKSDKSLTSVKSNKSEEKKDIFKKIRLNWISDMAYNFKPGILDDEFFLYRARISTGIDWLALGEGSYKNYYTRNALVAKQNEVDVLENILQKSQLSTKSKQIEVQHFFDNEKLKVVSMYQDILEKLYHFNALEKEHGLFNDSELALSKHQLDKISIEKKYLETKYGYGNNSFQNYTSLLYSEMPDLPAVESIDLDYIIKTKELSLQLQKDMLKEKEKNRKQLDVRLKFRYNYYVAEKNWNFASVGATINLPLTSESTKKADEYMINAKADELKDMRLLYKNTLYDLYREYYDAKKEIEIMENKVNYFQASLSLKSADENSDTFSPAGYLKDAGGFMENELSILEKKADLCDKYLAYMMYANNQNQEKMTTMTNPDNVGKDTYLWSSFFNNNTNTYLINLLNHWHITRVYVSAGSATNQTKLADFRSLAQTNNIQAYRLIGENSYAATDSGFVSLQNALIATKNMGFEGVHLDIEPHVFPDYKDNVELYAQRWINLFTSSKAWCDLNNMHLSVSVPMHLPLSVATALSQNNILTYIMAYDSLSLDKKLNKTADMRTILGSSNVVWVFRINDFTDFNALLSAETTVSGAGVTQIGYYDLSQMNLFKP